MSDTKQQGMILHPDNPFKEDLEQMFKTSKTANRTTEMVGPVTREKYTLTVEREYLPLSFTKMYQNTELLLDLSGDACKLLVYIACTLQYQEQVIKISPQLVGIERRRFSKAMVELLGKRIVVNHKHKWYYWVNITLLIVGTVNKPEIT